MDQVTNLDKSNPLSKALDIQARWFSAPHKSLRIKGVLNTGENVNMDIRLTKICAITVNVLTSTFVFQFCGAPTIKKFKDPSDKVGMNIPASSSSVAGIKIPNSETAHYFEDTMRQTYQRSMQLSVLQELLATPVRPDLPVGDIGLQSIFSHHQMSNVGELMCHLLMKIMPSIR